VTSEHDEVAMAARPSTASSKKAGAAIREAGQTARPASRPTSPPNCRKSWRSPRTARSARSPSKGHSSKRLTAAAIKKDIRAVNALLACMRYFGVGAEEQAAENVDVEDLDMLETYLAQQRKKENRNSDSAGSASEKPSPSRKKK